MDLDPATIQVCYDEENLGRYLMTTKPIKTGTVILIEKPLIHGPFLHTIPVCLGCYRAIEEQNHQRCETCGWPVCSTNCSKYQHHQAECQFTAAKGDKIFIRNFGIPHPNYQAITILRCLYLRENSPDLWKKLMDLQSNPTGDDLSAAEFVRRFFKLENFTVEEILKICGILKINAHEIPVTEPPYLAVYERASLFEHNCRANCSKTFTDNGEILITAAHDINDGEHLSICYTDPLWNQQDRRNHLYETKKFWCCCERCTDFTEFGTYYNSLKCQNLNCDGVITRKTPESDWFCNSCDHTVSAGEVEEILENLLIKFEKIPKSSKPLLKNFLQSSEQYLTPTHFLVVEAKLALLQTVENTLENFDYKMELIDELLGVFEKLIPAEYRLKGLLLYHKSQMIRHKPEEFKNIAQQCCELLKNEPKSLPEHEIYQKLQQQLKQ